MRYCYECGVECGVSSCPYVVCRSCKPEVLLRADQEEPVHHPDEPSGTVRMVRVVNLAALVGLGLILVLVVAFLAAAYYAS